MKVLFTIGSLAGGGAERVVSRLASCMAGRGDSVEIALIAQNVVDYPLDEKVDVRFINPKIQIRGMRYFLRCLELRNEVKRFDPDIVISFTTAVNIFVLDALRGTDYKILLSERNDPHNDPKDIKLRNRRDRLYRKADGIVFQTEDSRAYFDDDIQKRSKVILNPVDVPSEYIRKNNKEKKIVTVGRLEPQKNHSMLIKAFASIHRSFPDYRLEIYGEGSLRNELEELIRSEGLEDSVYLMGYTKNVFEAVSTAKLFVLSSDYEGMSNALLEAMAMGLPVVSTDHPIGGARMAVENGINGMLTPVGDSEALAAAVCQILENEQLSESLSQNAADISKRLDIDRITDEWTDFIHRMV